MEKSSEIKRKIKNINTYINRLSHKEEFEKTLETIHKNIFADTNCLQCANCCKNYSPILYAEDINRIANKLKITTKEFITEYLDMDEDGDFVFKQTPCRFLDENNYCIIYSVRPESCADYPHTETIAIFKNKKSLHQNALICAPALQILENLSLKIEDKKKHI